jgi:hypothetical protein
MIINSTYCFERIETDTFDVPDCGVRLLLVKLGLYSDEELTALLDNPEISLSDLVQDNMADVFEWLEVNSPDSMTTTVTTTPRSHFVGYTIEEVVTHA